MKSLSLRKPAVAGTFYPSSPAELKARISGFAGEEKKKTSCIACMLPHAGYIYSGKVAVETVSRINVPEKIVLIGPNHTGLGTAFSIETEGIWQTPLGEINIDSALAQEILKNSSSLVDDKEAHREEHSLEVELPILQYFRHAFEIVPICICSEEDKKLKEVGEAIAAAVKKRNLAGSCLIVASSDMTHYEAQESANTKDREAIKAILDLDAAGLLKKVRSMDISMCGYAPVCVMLACAKALGAKKGELVKYQTSGDVTGDKTSVVGYAGIIIS